VTLQTLGQGVARLQWLVRVGDTFTQWTLDHLIVNANHSCHVGLLVVFLFVGSDVLFQAVSVEVVATSIELNTAFCVSVDRAIIDPKLLSLAIFPLLEFI
jgi:hypothetical protein